MESIYTIVHLPPRAKEPRRTTVFKGVRRRGIPPVDPLEHVGPSREALRSPKLETAKLRRAEADDARRDASTLVVPPMPLTLVGSDPTASDDAIADADDDVIPWGLHAVGAHGSPLDGMGVRVAILDSGLDFAHVAFEALSDEGRIITHNFTAGAPDDVHDVTGHGTHCAGTICGGMVDGVRIGVAPRLDRLIIGKVLGPAGSSTEVVLRGLLWAVTEKNADIVSMSLGLDFPGKVQSLVEDGDLPLAQATSMALEDYREVLDAYRKLVAYLMSWDTLIIAATGNESRRPDYTINAAPPAAVDHVVSVAALECHPSGLHVAPFSNTRPTIAAPGVNVRSAKVGGGLIARNGTSMAAPHVAGVAALWCQHLREIQGDLAPDAVRSKLLGAATLNGLHPDSCKSRDVGNGLVRVPP